ncbi:hypothetical protein Bca4012_018437 [Brassica carinata]
MAVVVEAVVEEAVDTAVKTVVVMETMVEDVSVDTIVVVGGGGCRIFIHKTLNIRSHPHLHDDGGGIGSGGCGGGNSNGGHSGGSGGYHSGDGGCRSEDGGGCGGVGGGKREDEYSGGGYLLWIRCEGCRYSNGIERRSLSSGAQLESNMFVEFDIFSSFLSQPQMCNTIPYHPSHFH